MNLSIQEELQPFAEELQCYITPAFLEELAREIKFIKRKRKFSGSDLATLCIWVSQRKANDSLVRLCSQLHAATGNLLGINKRISQKAVVFLKSIFSVLWKSKLCETSAISSMTIQYFQRVRVLDVTIFQVPKYLASTYPQVPVVAHKQRVSRFN